MAHNQLEANKVELAYTKIKELVVNVRFKPGAQLHITELSEQLEVSVTPVREALTRLLAENLIAGIPNRGFFCKSLDVDELCALHEFAFVVLKHSIEQGLDADHAPKLFRHFRFDATPQGNELAARGDQAQLYALLIERLFTAIASLSGNELMIASIKRFNDQSHYMRVTDLERDGCLESVRPQMIELIRLLAARDAAAAVANLRHQFDAKLKRMPELAKEGLARAYLSGPTGARTTNTSFQRSTATAH